MVRLLPEGRPHGCSGEVGGAIASGAAESVGSGCPRFGLSQPCVRCLRALEALGVHRVIYSTGEAGCDGDVGCEVCDVHELLSVAETKESMGHCSRGDRSAIESGAVRRDRANAWPDVKR